MTVRHRGGKVVNDPLYGQRHLFLVYKQKINLAVETKSECYRNTVNDRSVSLVSEHLFIKIIINSRN